MKKLLSMAAIVLALGFSSAANAQDGVKQDVKNGAKKVGNKTAEVASKGKAKVTDQVYKDKVGPNGETVYMDNHSKYYWVDKKGHRHYVTEAELKPKTED